MINRFYLKELEIYGPKVDPIKLAFKPGLNIINGASDTGKSYTYECIDYLFGSDTLPREIPEARDYSHVTLEIASYDGIFITFQRSLQSVSNISLAKCQIEDFSGAEKITLKRKHQTGNPETFSYYIMKEFGLEDIQLQINKSNKKRTASIRDLVHLTLIDEVSIIKKTSPLLSGNFTTKTAEKSFFNFLMTGTDASNLKTVTEPKIKRSNINGQLELIETLIDQLANEIDQFNKIEINSDYEDNVLDRMYEDLEVTQQAEERLSEERISIWETLQGLQSRKIMIDELLNRFQLLASHYKSDLHRLEFVDEGNALLDQLISVNCPICGREFSNDHSHHDHPEIILTEDIMTAISSEVKKILVKLSDLEETVDTLKKERLEIEGSVSETQNRLSEIELLIRKILGPKIGAIRGEIESALEFGRRRAEFNSLADRMHQLLVQKYELTQKDKKKTKLENTEFIDYVFLKKFSVEVQEILSNWKYADSLIVGFDIKTFDIVINGEIRTIHGKGYRSISQTASIVALMNYCYSENRPHPGIVVIDSPLTAYKKADSISDKDRLSQDIETAFFEHLAKTPRDRQIIIFDNKEPSQGIKDQVNYIHFSKSEKSGRYGLFPIN